MCDDEEDYILSKQVFYWGRDSNGETIFEPKLVPELNKKNIVQLSCGSDFLVALSDSGDLYSWGQSNTLGQLGHGDSKNQFKNPKNIKKFSLIKALNGDSVIQLTTGLDFTYALTEQSSIYAWGSNIEGQLSISNIQTTNSFNNNNNNNNNNNTTTTITSIIPTSSQPSSVITTKIGQENSPFATATATSTSMFIDSLTSSTSSTRSYITLANQRAQQIQSQQQQQQQSNRSSINIGNSRKINVPNESINPFSSVNNFIKEIIGGSNSNQKSTNTTTDSSNNSTPSNNSSGNNSPQLLNYGNCNDTQIKYKVSIPLKILSFGDIGVEGMIKITQISCGSNHILALTSNGLVYSWGSSENGKLGHGESLSFVSNIPRFLNIPMKIKILEDRSITIISISAGYSHCMALTSTSEILCWGKGQDGQCGTGFTHDIWSPYQIKRVIEPNEKIVQISCGYFNSFFITFEKRQLYYFGWGLTLGKSTDILIPTKFVSGNKKKGGGEGEEEEEERIKQVSSGYSHTLILNENGYVMSIGNGEYGQLGVPQDHSSINKDYFINSPTIIPGFNSNLFVESIQCGRWHSVCITSNRELKLRNNKRKQQKQKQLLQQSLKHINLFNNNNNNSKYNTIKSSTDDLDQLEEFESNIEEIERMISQTVGNGNGNSNGINGNGDDDDGLSINFTSFIDFKSSDNDTMVTTNDEFEKSFFLIQQDYAVYNNNNSNNSNINNINNGDSDEEEFKKPFYSFLFKKSSNNLSSSTSSTSSLNSSLSSSSSSVLTIGNGNGNGNIGCNGNGNTIGNGNGSNNNNIEEQEELIQLYLTKFLPEFEKFKDNRRQWRELWRRGIPPTIRGIIWKRRILDGKNLEITGAIYHGLLAQLNDLQVKLDNDIQRNDENGGFEANLPPNLPMEYQRFIKNHNMINVDLPRTFPQLRLFGTTGALHEQLKTVLLLFSLYTPQIGYVQGMSYLAGVFCLYMDPFESFVCFTNLLNNHFFHSLFTMNIKEIVQHVKIFNLLFKNNVPKLFDEFQKLGLSTEHFLLEWLMTMFTKQLPLNIVFRVWDCCILEGEAFIYRVAIGILKQCRNFIFGTSFEESLAIIKSIPHNLKEEDLFDSITSVQIPKFVKKIIKTMNKDYL